MPREAKAKVLAYLDTLDDGTAICHGDFHPQNVLITTDGPVIIDCADATVGHPLADVARSSLVLERATAIDEPLSRQIETPRRRFLENYLARYRKLRPSEPAELADWSLPV